MNDLDLAQKVVEEASKKINELINTRMENLEKGRATDYAEYKNVVGQLRGLRESDDILKQIYKRLEDV